MAVYKTSTSGLLTRTEYSSFLAGNTMFDPWESPGAYDSIATTTVGAGGSSSITFSSIPQGYTHLQIRAMVLTSSQNNMLVRFNGDTGSNYALHQLQGNGSAASAEYQSSEVRARICLLNPNANYPAVSITDILDYRNTSKAKTIRTLWGADANAANTQARVGLTSGLWTSTAAITSIELYGSPFTEYSSFALYGIKGN